MSKLPMVPEHLVGNGISEWDHLQLAGETDAQGSLIECLTKMPYQNMLMVANGATGTIPEDIFRHYFSAISLPTSNVQLSSTLSKHLQQIRKRLCHLLPGLLACVKKSLDSILKKNLSCLFYNKIFKDDICIVFKNDRSIKNLIVKTKL